MNLFFGLEEQVIKKAGIKHLKRPLKIPQSRDSIGKWNDDVKVMSRDCYFAIIYCISQKNFKISTS